MKRSSLKTYKGYHWIVKDPDYVNGRLAIRGTRLPVSLILQCLGEGMTVREIKRTYTDFPDEALREVMLVAAQALEEEHVAA
ncbi:MAG: DUF433 domain-containing protein [Acidobacteria bacterium]|nr:DUF433 domain-containing protein [Acidobacteriota bacterium]MCI0627746.1 DUF433 domain-containing protein [Acidobacteriota bacterium]MCI0717808.1 DUF433 domain-containing protein [Acidobacteriota bacterium]